MANVDIARIATNIGALNALKSLEGINRQLSIHQERLASGNRINNASDDPAGLTIGTKLRARSDGLKVALANIGDAKNLLAVAEAGIGRINDLIVEMKNKVSQAASDTLGLAEREAVLAQLRAYATQIDDIVTQTEWNGNKLIDGTYDSTSLLFQTGAGSSDTTSVDGIKNLAATNQTTGLKLAFKTTTSVASYSTTGGMTMGAAITIGATTLSTGLYQLRITNSATALADSVELLDAGGSVIASSTGFTLGASVIATLSGISFNVTAGIPAAGSSATAVFGFTKMNDIDISTNGGQPASPLPAATQKYLSSGTDFRTYLQLLESKLNVVSSMMARVGAFTGRLTYKEEQVTTAQINTEASYSRIMNANMAEEQVSASKMLILQQSATAMLAQANAAPQFILSLFQ